MATKTFAVTVRVEVEVEGNVFPADSDAFDLVTACLDEAGTSVLDGAWVARHKVDAVEEANAIELE